MYTKEELKKDLINIGLKNNDKVLIHSSKRSVNADAMDILKAIEEIVYNGLIVYPTHTWAYIREDMDIFNNKKSPSNVGYLTNFALENGYIRSNHPTHSVCAKGINVQEFIHLDDFSNTPCNPNGCHGYFKNGKILFLGAPLSKNTFIHSIEEEMNVPNRFTSKKYHFISKNEIDRNYYVYRHYNEKCPHISDNYEKLLPAFLELGIAKYGKIGDSDSYLIDGNMCNKFVKHLLKCDIHLFDDLRKIKKEYILSFRSDELWKSYLLGIFMVNVA